MAERALGSVEEPDMAEGLIAFGGFGDDERDASAVGRKLKA